MQHDFKHFHSVIFLFEYDLDRNPNVSVVAVNSVQFTITLAYA